MTSSTPVSPTERPTPSRTWATSIRLAPPSPEPGEQGGERARLVGDGGEHPQAPAALGLVVAGDVGQNAGVDVAAREDHHGGPGLGRRRRAAWRSAATPTAPAPSTTSFVRSRSSMIASAIASSSTVTELVEQALEQRRRDLARVLDRDPVGERAVRLDPDHLDVVFALLDRRGDSRCQAAAADRDQHARRGPGPPRAARARSSPGRRSRPDRRRGGRRRVPRPRRGRGRRSTQSSTESPASMISAPDSRAAAILARAARSRHEDRRRQPAGPRRVGQRLAVVARARRDHALHRLDRARRSC